MERIDEQEYFKLIRNAWNLSKIKKEQPNWGWSLAATQLYKQNIVIVGFNWGVGQKIDEIQQSKLPTDPWAQQDLGSLNRAVKYMKNNFTYEQLNHVVQTNYCFFKTKSEDQISEDDLKLCYPIFKKLIWDLNPALILIFSAKLRDRIRNELVPYLPKQFSSGKRNAIAAKGIWTINDQKVPVHIVPHPQSKISTEAREKCWKWVFSS